MRAPQQLVPKREPTLHHPIEKGPTYFGFVTSISCNPPQTTPRGNQSITFSRNHWPRRTDEPFIMAVCHFRGPVPEWLCFASRLPDRPGGGSSHISALLARAAGSRSSGGSGTQVRTYCKRQFVSATCVCTSVKRDCTSLPMLKRVATMRASRSLRRRCLLAPTRSGRQQSGMLVRNGSHAS